MDWRVVVGFSSGLNLTHSGVFEERFMLSFDALLVSEASFRHMSSFCVFWLAHKIWWYSAPRLIVACLNHRRERALIFIKNGFSVFLFVHCLHFTWSYWSLHYILFLSWAKLWLMLLMELHWRQVSWVLTRVMHKRKTVVFLWIK